MCCGTRSLGQDESEEDVRVEALLKESKGLSSEEEAAVESIVKGHGSMSRKLWGAVDGAGVLLSRIQHHQNAGNI